MITYAEPNFLELLNEKFADEIKQNDLKLKLLKLNGNDILIFINKCSKVKMNCTVMDTNIKFAYVDDNNVCEIYILEDSIEELFKKIKKTIFNICLVK